MKVREFKQLMDESIPEEHLDCEIVVPVNGFSFGILGISHHGHYTKPGGLPYELNIG